MSADRDRVLKRVTEILNLVDAGTYTATLSARNKTRNEEAIADMTDEAGLMMLKAIAERPNEYRYQFADTTTITTSPDAMPPHIGPLMSVSITPYSGGNAVEGKQKNYQKVQSYRANINKVYDEIDHDEEGSSLSGYYDVWEDKFYFTGLSADIEFARLPVRADTATLIPEILESTWIKLAVGNAEKVGTGQYETSVINKYLTQGMSDLDEFKAGSRQFKEADEPDTARGVHV